jgi:hypothetical protein
MRVQLPSKIYTQINTNTDEYLIQNISTDKLYIIVSDTPPANDADFDLIIQPGDAISNIHVVGTCWGKPSGKNTITVGVVEG